MILRDYQAHDIERLRQSYAAGGRAPIYAAHTGSGKTVAFAAIVASATARGRRTLIVVHKRELVRQTVAKLAWAGVPHGIIAAGFAPSPDEPVQVCSIQTAIRRLATLPAFDLIVLDEAHHARAETWKRLLAAQPQAKLLGCTATPARYDGKGLGIQAGGCFDDLVVGASVAQLVAGGYLTPAHCYVPAQRLDLGNVRVRAGDYIAEDLAHVMDRAKITGDAVEHYRLRADHQPAIAFCTTIKHAEHVAAAFGAAGYRAACVHGGTPTDQRDALITGLGDGSFDVLTNCSLVDEGVDVPDVRAVILLRPTKSLVLHRQQIGRGLRPALGKDELVVNDHVGNCLMHGLPETEIAWSLSGVEKRPGAAPVWKCPECGCANPIAVRACAACGYEKPTPLPYRRDVPLAARGDLSRLTAEQLAAVRRMSYREIVSQPRSEAELRAFADARGYKPGWVWHRLQEQREGGAA